MDAGILLSAGFGTRLKPLTDRIPKPAVPFLGHPMIWYAMRAMKTAGIHQIAANVHHLPDEMSRCLAECAHELGIHSPAIFRENGEILGTGGGARSCMQLLPDAERFVIYHGDVLCGADIQKILQEHKKSGADVSMVVAKRPENLKLGMIGVCRHQVVQIRDWKDHRFVHEMTEPACFTGIHVVERHFLERLPSDHYVCLVTEIYREMLENGRDIHAVMTDAYFADIGTPETYFEAQREVSAHPEKLPGASRDVFPPVLLDDWETLCHNFIDVLAKET